MKATGEMIEAAAAVLYSEGGDYADDGMRGALLLAEKTMNAALALAPLSRSGDSALVEAPGKQIGYAVASRGQIFVETVSPHRRAAIVNWLVTRRGVFVANNWTDGEIEIAWQQHRSSSDEAIAVAIFPLAEIDKFIQQHGERK